MKKRTLSLLVGLLVSSSAFATYEIQYVDQTSYDDDETLAELADADVGFCSFGLNAETDCTNFDESNKTINYTMYYHSTWLAEMPTKGMAYARIKHWADVTQKIYSKVDSDYQLNLVAFKELPDPTGEHQSLDTDDVNSRYNWFRYIENNYYKKSLGYIESDDELIDNGTLYNVIDEPTVETDQADYGSDYFFAIVPTDVDTSDDATDTVGYAGMGDAVLMDDTSFDMDETAIVPAHEMGHSLQANHEDRGSRSTGNLSAFYGNRATTCDVDGTTLHTVMQSYVPDTDTTYYGFSTSEPDTDGVTCGDETHNNAHYIKKFFPLLTNVHNDMDTYGNVWISSDDVTVEQGNSFTVTVQRDGDTTEAALVELYMENASFYGNDNHAYPREFLDEDFVDVEFAAGESTKTITFTAPETTYSAYNTPEVITAQLVLPLHLVVTGDTKSVTIGDATSDDDSDSDDSSSDTGSSDDTGSDTGSSSSSSSSGGAMGWLGLVFLGFAGFTRRKMA